MNTERLLRLADKLQGLGPYVKEGPVDNNKFSLIGWLGCVNDDIGILEEEYREDGWVILNHEMAPLDTISDEGKSILSIVHGTCGTSACACGWAALDPWFIERGLWITSDGMLVSSKWIEGADGVEYKSDLTNHEAAMDFFDIEHHLFSELFTADDVNDDRSPDQVGNAIRAKVDAYHFEGGDPVDLSEAYES